MKQELELYHRKVFSGLAKSTCSGVTETETRLWWVTRGVNGKGEVEAVVLTFLAGETYEHLEEDAH